MSDDSLMTTGDAAKFLKLKPKGIEGLVSQGKLTAYKVSQRIVRFEKGQLLRDVQKFRYTPPAKNNIKRKS
jgi:hypothetical protein